MKKIFITLSLVTFSMASNAAPLSANSPEVKQLSAMGYEIRNEKDSSQTTVMSNGSTNIVLTTNGERLVIFRMFIRKKDLNPTQEYELLKLVNDVNINSAFQVALGNGYFTTALYSFAPYDAKTFAKMIRLIEKADSVFDTNDKFLSLIN